MTALPINGRRLRAAVVGCQVGARHARTYRRLSKYFDLTVIAEADAALLGAVAEELGNVAVAANLEAVLARGDIDVVSICTPPSLHYRQILETLAAGCHVVCEKPLVGSLRDLDLLQEAAARTGRSVVPIFQLRFGRGLQKLKRLVELGVTGRCYLTSIETAWKRGPDYYAIPWRGTWRGALGGCLLGHAVHAHDMLCHVLGPVARVSAMAKTMVNPIETEDTVAAAIEMKDGSLATLAVTLGSAKEISRLRFCFEHLVAESNTHPYEYSSDPWIFTGSSTAINREIAQVLTDTDVRAEGYEEQFAGMHRALTAGAEPPVTLAEARASIELATALYYSAEQSSVVSLPIGADHPIYQGFRPKLAQACCPPAVTLVPVNGALP